MKISTLRGTIGPYLTIRAVPRRIKKRLLKENRIKNPAYEQAERFSSYNAVADDIQEYLEFAWEYEPDNEVICYRGALEKLPSTMQHLRKITKWNDERIMVPATFPKLRLEWNEEQKYCMEALEDVLKHNRRPFGNLLFLASTSVGKTILQASVAARLGQRALIICPTDLIMRAWYDDLNKAFGLSRGDVGLIKRNKFDIGKHFTLASLQTLGRRRHKWAKLNRKFGTIVVDEVQGCSAETLHSFLTQSPAKYLVGATATTETRDGENHHLKALFGSPIVQVNTYHRETQTSLPISEVRLVNTSFKYRCQIDNLDWHDLAMNLCGDEDRNALIVKNIYKEWSSGRSVLVVTKTREHATLLTEMLLEAGIKNVNEINGETNQNKFYTDKLLQWVKERKVTCIVATLQAIKTGANIPMLDSLHVAMPPANKRDWEQLLGRIRRKAEGKKSAIVTFYYDALVPYMMNLFKRIVIPVFRKMKCPGYENMYVA
jgi:superfamily II DNA or RNA helicase